MFDVAFISDLHLGHTAIMKLRGFEYIDEYNEEIIKRINSVCGKKTLLFVLGDITMENKKYIPLLGRLNCRIVLVGGNHDERSDFKLFSEYVESMSGCIEYKGFILTHIPIHAQEIDRFRGNIHGHLHEKTVKRRRYSPMKITVTEEEDERYLNVSWDRLEGIPISLERVLEKFKKPI